MKQNIPFWASIFLCIACTFSAQPVVIIIHGSFASTTTWPQPDGDFFKELENQARELNQNVVSFCWSGIPTDQEIIKGGKMLAQLIMSYSEQEEIVLVGHSHGGNVINIASQLLYKLTQHEKPALHTELNSIVLELPLFITTPNFHMLATTKTGSQPQALYSEDQLTQDLVTQAVTELRHWAVKFLTRSNANRSIEFSYLLGTPVNMAKFWPSMEIIKHMILLYSDGDFIQPVLGMFEKTYPAHQRCSNVKVKLYASGQTGKAPSHADLHHPVIGRWLLCIPKILTQLKMGKFENFKFGTNGTINFYGDKEPDYLA